MAFKRKRPARAQRRRVRRRLVRPRVPRPIRKTSIVLMKRTSYQGAWTFGTSTTSDFWRYFVYDMNAFNNFSDVAAVFDEYKINGIKVTFRPAYDNIQNQQGTGLALVQPQAYAHVIVDPASTIVPSGVYASTSLNTFLMSEGVKTKTLNKPFSVYYRPKVTDQVFGTGTSSVMRNSPWIRSTEYTPLYRGFHMYLQQNNFTTGNINIKLDMFVTFYAAFRNVR